MNKYLIISIIILVGIIVSYYPNTPSSIEFMEAKKTVWSIFRDYVNSKKTGGIVTLILLMVHT